MIKKITGRSKSREFSPSIFNSGFIGFCPMNMYFIMGIRFLFYLCFLLRKQDYVLGRDGIPFPPQMRNVLRWALSPGPREKLRGMPEASPESGTGSFRCLGLGVSERL